MEHNPFVALLLITGLAFIVPFLATQFRRISIPIVVGEIFAGIIIGQSGLNLVEPSATLNFLSEFGFAFLMFLSGLEVDVDLLMPSRRGDEERLLWVQAVPMALIVFLGTLGLGMVSAMWLSGFEAVQSPVLLALILSTTSLGVVVPVLKEKDLLNSRFGQYLLAAASIADFVTLLLLTVLIAVRSQGLTLDLLLIPALLAVFFAVARVSQIFSRVPVLNGLMEDLAHATAQIRVRGAFALLVAWVVLAEALGVELILGAFLAGTIASLMAEREDSSSREKLDAIGYGFFIPIFFIMVGVEFNLPALIGSTQALLLVPILIGLAVLVKLIPSLFYRLTFSWRESISAGLLLSSRLSLIIAAAAIAVNIGVISEAMNAAIILLAILSSTFSPMLFNRIFPERTRERRQGIIMVGTDQMTEFLTERFSEHDEAVTVVCSDDEGLKVFRDMGVPVVLNEEDIEGALIEAGADQARVLVDLTNTVEETMLVSRIARERFKIPLVVSRIGDVDLIPRLQDMGVKVVQPALATAMALEGAIRYPGAFDVLVHQAEGVDINEVTLRNRHLGGRSIRSLNLPGDVIILSVKRGDTVLVPHSDTVLELGDRVGMIGEPEAIGETVIRMQG